VKVARLPWRARRVGRKKGGGDLEEIRHQMSVVPSRGGGKRAADWVEGRGQSKEMGGSD